MYLRLHILIIERILKYSSRISTERKYLARNRRLMDALVVAKWILNLYVAKFFIFKFVLKLRALFNGFNTTTISI